VNLRIRAGGALAVFGLIYLVNPAQFVNPNYPLDSPVEKQALAGTVWTEDGEPLAGVKITLPAFKQTTTTDSQGQFRFQVTAPREESVELMACKAGYRTYTQYATLGNTTLSFTLGAAP
jgi:hypothetical protein